MTIVISSLPVNTVPSMVTFAMVAIMRLRDTEWLGRTIKGPRITEPDACYSVPRVHLLMQFVAWPVTGHQMLVTCTMYPQGGSQAHPKKCRPQIMSPARLMRRNSYLGNRCLPNSMPYLFVKDISRSGSCMQAMIVWAWLVLKVHKSSFAFRRIRFVQIVDFTMTVPKLKTLVTED